MSAGLKESESFTGTWAWLFPLTYLIHVAEEYWGNFPAWINRIWGIESSVSNFMIWNGAAWALMIVGVALVLKTKSYRWLLVSFGMVVLINATSHTIASLVTASYSPGLISGVLLWVPLGTITMLRASKRVNRRTFRAGIIVGILMHAVVTLLAFSSAILSS
ncbi:MAG TPA: HXXEE domain-containing protein [Pyrinomonadaceae bacterium]